MASRGGEDDILLIEVKDRSVFRSLDTERVLHDDDVEVALTIPR
jgi:hypothetical protein